MRGQCGCGARAVYRLEMTDRLWEEYFSGPWPRPATYEACASCTNEFQKLAAPLVVVERLWSTQSR